MREVNHQTISQTGHTPIDSIKELILIEIIFRIQPLFLQFSPYRFCDVQMRRIWRKKKYVQSSFLPIWNTFLNGFSLMHTGIIQYHKRFLGNLKRKFFHIFQNKLSINISLGDCPSASALPVYKTKAVDFIGFFRKDADIFIGKLPAVRDISFAAHMGLISIIQVDFSFSADLLKFFKFFYLKTVILSERLPFGAAPYPSISSAKLFKKVLKVLSLTLLPLFTSHSALAVRIRCRLALMAARIPSLSSSRSITGLRPRPDLVYKPDIPSDLYRLSQLLTLIWHIPVIVPTSFEVRPSDFSNTLWQRIRKQWLRPFRNPDSNSLRSSDVRIGVFTRPIMGDKVNNIKGISKNPLSFSVRFYNRFFEKE